MTPEEFKEKLKAIGWSQRKLASVVGMHPNSISKMIASGKINNLMAEYITVRFVLMEVMKR